MSQRLTRSEKRRIEESIHYGHTLREIWNFSKQRKGKEYWRDSSGKLIYLYDFGKTWQIDHKHPRARGGNNELYNLEPLNSNSNTVKSDEFQLTTRKKLHYYLSYSDAVNKQLITKSWLTRKFKLIINKKYYVYQTPHIKIPSVATLLSIKRKVATVKFDNGRVYKMYASKMLFEPLF